MGSRGALPRRLENYRCPGPAPQSARCREDQGRRAAVPSAIGGREPKSWAQLVFARVVDHALDIDDVFLVTRIEQQLRAAARSRQIDVDDLLDAARRTR